MKAKGMDIIMKMIKAIVRPEAFEGVKEELYKANVHKMTVYNVKGCGQQKGYTENYRGNIIEVNLLNKICFEIVVNDDFVDVTVEAISKAARTKKIGDGKIFVLPVEKCYRIRTGEEGNNAVG